MRSNIKDIDFIRLSTSKRRFVQDVVGNGVGSIFIELEYEAEKREYTLVLIMAAITLSAVTIAAYHTTMNIPQNNTVIQTKNYGND